MDPLFESTPLISRLKEKVRDEDLTLSREQVKFLFDYIEALELALSYAAGEEAEAHSPSLVARYVEEALPQQPAEGESAASAPESAPTL